MRDDYKIEGTTVKLQIEVEQNVAEKLGLMETYSKLTKSEIVNTALKRFISSHKDFLPPDSKKN